MTDTVNLAAFFREDIDSLELRARGQPKCVIHARALRRWTGGRLDGAACIAFFMHHRAAFDEALRLKSRGTSPSTAFHLTSRDIAAVLDRHDSCKGPVQT